jgi:putative ABC transport system permease protein
MMKYILLTWKNLKRNRRRLVVTSVSVSISIFVFCALITIVHVVDSFLERANKSELIGVADRYDSAEEGMPQTHINKIREIAGVRAAMGVNLAFSSYRDEKDNITLWAADHLAVDKVLATAPGFDNALPEADFRDFERERTGALIGKVWTTKYGWKKGDMIMLKAVFPNASTPMADVQLKLAGEIPSGFWDSRIIIHRDYYEELSNRRDRADVIMVSAESFDAIQPVCSAIESALLNSSVPVKATSSAEFFNRFMAGLNLKSIITVISFVVFVATISITANSIAMSVRERKREVAILKSLGYRNSLVLTLLLGESVLTTFIGGCVGSLVAYLLFSSAGMFLKVGPLSYFEVPPVMVLYGLGGAILIGLLSGSLPSLSACRMPIVKALRDVS